MGTTAYQKISVNLSNEVLAVLRDIAEKDSVTMTEALRRAISTLKFVNDADADGKDVLVRDRVTKETERIVFR